MSQHFIEINLRPGAKKKKKRGAKAAEFKLPNFKELAAQITDPLLIGAIASWVVSLIFIGVVYAMERNTLAEIDPQLTALERERRDLREEIAAREESDSLVQALSSELTAIRGIDAKRYVWPHILEEITAALPAFTWLVSIEFLPSTPGLGGLDVSEDPLPAVLITGRTSDIQSYTGFLRRLAESDWLKNVAGGSTTMVEEEGRSVLDFSVTVQYKIADSFDTIPVLATEG
ncbi:MAG: PilN domain-containing protein [Gemmatimonadetes bacterium]|nr:PilN domain-containing protein [Gemmatimonadota bacterium]